MSVCCSHMGICMVQSHWSNMWPPLSTLEGCTRRWSCCIQCIAMHTEAGVQRKRMGGGGRSKFNNPQHGYQYHYHHPLPQTTLVVSVIHHPQTPPTHPRIVGHRQWKLTPITLLCCSPQTRDNIVCCGQCVPARNNPTGTTFCMVNKMLFIVPF